MPTVSEDWHAKKEKQDAILKRYVGGELSLAVLEASLYALGLRNDYLASEVRFAITSRFQVVKRNIKPVKIIVMECGRDPQCLRFTNLESADNAIKLLRKQPEIMLAAVI